MSKQAFDAFRAKLLEELTLREELERTLIRSDAKGTAPVDEVVAFAKARGYDFDAEHVPQNDELGDEQLDAVAGGTDKFGRIKVQFTW